MDSWCARRTRSIRGGGLAGGCSARTCRGGWALAWASRASAADLGIRIWGGNFAQPEASVPWQSFRLHAFPYSFIYLEEGNRSVMSHRLWRMDNLSDSADATAAGTAGTAFWLSFFLLKKKRKLINCSFQLICRLHSWEMATEDGGLKYGNCTMQLLAWLAADIQCATTDL